MSSHAGLQAPSTVLPGILRLSILGCSFATLAAALGACSSVDRAEESRVVSDSQTGSNIPKKSRTGKVQTIDTDAVQPLPPPFRPPARAASP